MFTELAEIKVKAGHSAAFEADVAKAVPFFLKSKGCHGVALHRVVEHPDVYRLLVKWERVSDHMEGFRNSENFLEWRRLASPHFESSPQVTHSSAVDLA